MLTGRVDALADAIEARELDALLVADPVNLRYLTGFSGTNGMAVVGAGGSGVRRFITDFRYVERAQDEVSGFDRREGERDLLEALAEALPEKRPLKLGFDDEHTSVRARERLGEALGDEVEVVAASGIVEKLRAVKEPTEIQAMRAAADLADDALRSVLESGLVGRTEREFALALEDAMRHNGAQEPSFASIVAAGSHGALPHAEPRDVKIERGELVVVDWGARLDGYCSDCTRTFAAGEVDEEAREVYALVLDAQEQSLAAVKPGPTGKEVDAVARDIIEAAGHGERFGHGLGHGVGLEVHEGPRLSKGGDDPLVAGNVVTVEPGIYLSGRFGVRIEDLVVVTADGADVLSSLSKQLTFIG